MNNKNKIVKPIASVFIHCYPPALGGAEYLAEKFVEVLKIKYQVHVFTGRGETLDSYKTFDHYLSPGRDPNIHRLEINRPVQRVFNKLFNKLIFVFGHFSPFYFGPILRYTAKDIDIIKKSEFIFGIAMPTKSFYDAYQFASKFSKKLILIPAYHNVNYYNRSIFFQKAFDYAHRVFYLTPYEKDELVMNYRVEDSKLVQTTFCPYTKEQIAAQLKRLPSIIKRHKEHFKNKQITIGFIGQITLRKNLGIFKEYLDKYLAEWEIKGYDFKVYLSGARTNSSDQIESLFDGYLDKRIVTIKFDFKDVNKDKEFSKIDIFVNPSEEESMGIVNFEAIYNGLPTLTLDKSAFSSLDQSYLTFIKNDDLHSSISRIIHTNSKNMSIINTFSTLNRYNIKQHNKIFKKMKI